MSLDNIQICNNRLCFALIRHKYLGNGLIYDFLFFCVYKKLCNQFHVGRVILSNSNPCSRAIVTHLWLRINNLFPLRWELCFAWMICGFLNQTKVSCAYPPLLHLSDLLLEEWRGHQDVCYRQALKTTHTVGGDAIHTESEEGWKGW